MIARSSVSEGGYLSFLHLPTWVALSVRCVDDDHRFFAMLPVVPPPPTTTTIIITSMIVIIVIVIVSTIFYVGVLACFVVMSMIRIGTNPSPQLFQTPVSASQ